MALTTVARCKAFRNIDGDNAEHDDELARLIQAAQRFLEEECQRQFDSATVTEYYHGDRGRDQLRVARPPITSITNIWDDPSRVYTTAIETTRYAIDEAGLILLLDNFRFSAGLRNIKITYVGGYAVIPEDLAQAAIEMVWAAREKGLHNLIGVRSRSVADGNLQFVNLDWGSINLAPIIQKYSLKTGLG